MADPSEQQVMLADSQAGSRREDEGPLRKIPGTRVHGFCCFATFPEEDRLLPTLRIAEGLSLKSWSDEKRTKLRWGLGSIVPGPGQRVLKAHKSALASGTL